MDALSRVLELAQIRGSLDLRCLFAGGFAVDHPPMPTGEAPFHLMLQGAAVVELPDGSSQRLAAGELLLLPRGNAHLVRDVSRASPIHPMKLSGEGIVPIRRNTDRGAEVDLLCGRFVYAPGAADLIMRSLPDVLHLSLEGDDVLEGLRGIVSLLRREVEEPRPGGLELATALTRALFVLVLRGYGLGDGVRISLLALLGDLRLSRAVTAMLQDPGKDWTLSLLAEQAAMSRATFARQFARKSDKSPMELLTVLRMQLAGEWLRQGQLAIGDVAERVGYQSESAFGKAFFQYMGATPAHFRRAHGQLAEK
ncbi:AraC family transcriptional regulator [Dyella choica]|uniref:AraC family transcriptional regulator n=1 Tax=Dyella choica TaxID=1927959 RepID=A0A3S0PJ44_9GAMM|nr:AraC family transcriptional regulator [Dyella choica]RUL76632.1 AraC family transcriptional regulator [Dyella choica]